MRPDIEKWIHDFEALPFVRRVEGGQAENLIESLDEARVVDGYVASLPYYQLTGRKGMWLCVCEGAFLFVCLHPNVEGRVLVFPPFGKNGVGLLQELCESIPMPPAGAQLARFLQHQIEAAQSGIVRRCLRVVEERVLDWRYPCRILATQEVVARQGKAFREVRKCVNRIERLHVEVESLGFDALRAQASGFRHLWSSSARIVCGAPDSQGYYEALFGGGIRAGRLLGNVYRVKNKVEGFSFWELPIELTKPVLGHAHMANPAVRSLSAYGIFVSCRILAENGFAFVNMGGSEDGRLDHFKRSFVPRTNYGLMSAEIVPA